jgi:hypothetical protein
VNHKNSRFLMFDDVDMGEEVEAAIYNDGKHAPDSLKDYVNKQMNRIMSTKMNQLDHKLNSEELGNPTPLDLSHIERNQILFHSPLKPKSKSRRKGS